PFCGCFAGSSIISSSTDVISSVIVCFSVIFSPPAVYYTLFYSPMIVAVFSQNPAGGVTNYWMGYF
ncbi:hypothetical protein KY382_34840, partial [Pseudomonas monteilii]|nr:hypothetical protein [Pseudomonas monteilii]